MMRSVWVSMMSNPFSAMASAWASPQYLPSLGCTSYGEMPSSLPAPAARRHVRDVVFLPGHMRRNERVADPIEQAGREEAEFIAVRLRRFPQIIARPHEFVAFGDDDPRARIVKTAMLFDRQRNFNRDATFPPVRLD